MKAIRFEKTGGPEVLKLEGRRTSPAPAPGYMSPRAPYRGRCEFHRHVSPLRSLQTPASVKPWERSRGCRRCAWRAAVTTLKVGDRVAYADALGAYAEANNVPADKLVKLPAGVSEETAAAAMLKGMTAQYLLDAHLSRAIRAKTILFHAPRRAVSSAHRLPVGKASRRDAGDRHGRLGREGRARQGANGHAITC